MATKTQPTYTILRNDLFPTLKDLEKLLESYKASGLNVDKQIKKLIELGYIKKD